jgi:hypothetical protein
MLDLGAISFHSLSIVQVSWLDFPFIILYTHEDFKADIKLEGRDVDFNMSGEEIESGIEEPLDPSLENIARYR